MDEKELLEKIEHGAKNSFVIYESPKVDNYLSGLITNDNKKDHPSLDTFGSVLCDEIATCDEFFFSVAFITTDGVEAIRNSLEIAKAKGVKGKILTTDYETFTSPIALDNLDFQYSENIELKLYRCEKNDGFHPKAYIFHHKDYYRVYIGSSNLTRRALDVNKEWNTKVVCSSESDYLKHVLSSFDKDWNAIQSKCWRDCSDYAKIYQDHQQLRKELELSLTNGFCLNDMQKEFVSKLQTSILRQGKKKVLLVSATGSGKTYASALGAQAIHAKRVLFVMNREKVLADSMKTFKNVFHDRKERDFSLFTGGKKFDEDAKFIFATPQMIVPMIRERKIPEDYFDFVILDEIHHLGLIEKAQQNGALSQYNQYGEIFHYFQPGYGTLGMSATPIRSDGFDILSEFDNNVICQFTLMDSLLANLVCPFFYFGIDDEYYLDDSSTFFKRINKKGTKEDEYQKYISELCSENHVRKILMQSLSHIYSGSRLRSLVFVPTIDIGKKLQDSINSLLNEAKEQMHFKGFLGKAEFTQESNERLSEQIRRFETEDVKEDDVTYLITVDKLSEGVDIPSTNQVIFLRPTSSPIVFSQQLGRGLRLGKGYLVVLDFIGNNDRMSYLLPMSLLGNGSHDKFLSATAASHGRITLPGGSIVTLTPKAKEEILKAIDKANFYEASIFKDAYSHVKGLIGRTPSMIEFQEFGNVDASSLVFTTYKNYYSLVSRCDKDNVDFLSEKEVRQLTYLQRKIGCGKRIEEPLLLFFLLTQENGFNRYRKEMKEEYNHPLTEYEIEFSYRILTLQFEKDKKIVQNNSDCIFLCKDQNGNLCLAKDFANSIHQNPGFKKYLLFLLEYAIKNHESRYKNHYRFIGSQKKQICVPFCLNETYSYQDYYTLLEKKQNKNPRFVGGYDTAKGEDIIPIFVNYKKNQDERFNYNDHFLDESHFIWYTKEKTRIDSPFIKRVKQYKENNLKFLLFIRKEKKQTKEFYFLGSIHPNGSFNEEIKSGKDKKETTVVRIEMVLDTPVDKDLYNHLTYRDKLSD